MPGNFSAHTSLYSSASSFNVTLVVLYVTIVLVGLIGNSLVVAIVFKTRSMFTSTNILLANVAVADIVSLLWCPIPLIAGLCKVRISPETAHYLCKFFTSYSVTGLTVSVTYQSLVVLAVERYHAIVKPFSNTLMLTNHRMFCALLAIWIVAIICSLPGFIFSEYDEKLGRCLDPWTLEKAGTLRWIAITTLTASVFFFGALFYCYFQILRGIFVNKTVCSTEVASMRQSNLKDKRRLAIISLTVTVAYHLCYLPFLIFELYITFQSQLKILENYEELYKVYRIVGFIMYVNSMLNPFVYGFQSSNYRNNFRRLFFRGSPRVDVRMTSNFGQNPPSTVFSAEK
ncbi:somatostatin receptor type 5-like [Stylophora pistillata]|uniref:somatostatin receptor type 5-like n=1 Tax=Stylophora pistillata TaxID=50429 RepID=UPI000C043BA9|nr:somatostatin receptor type 5-like [Stylophora pistillata]